MTLWDLAEEQERAEFAASNTKTYGELIPGDVVEVRRPGGVERGWVIGRHGSGSLEVCLDLGHPWSVDDPDRQYFPLWSNSEDWRFVEHDTTWALHPTPEELREWMVRTASTLAADRFHDLYHAASDMWPTSVPEEWRAVMRTTFTELAIRYVPLKQYLRNHRIASNRGRKIWACPQTVCDYITESIWPLSGDERLDATMALRWTRAEHFGDANCKWPDDWMAFNRRSFTIYDGYLRWAVAHADSPRQLLEILDDWGSNGIKDDDAASSQRRKE